MAKIKILFVSANPSKTPALRLDEEAREIEAKIRAATHRDALQLITQWATRPDDLLQSLNEHRPHIVHFSGHGSKTEELILLDKNGAPKPVNKPALASLFGTLKDNIRVVILNACYSWPQAKQITKHIDCTIGMSRAISDNAAITFAASFYRAIGFGRTVKESFEQGKTALLLEGIPEATTPELVTRLGISAERINLLEFVETPDVFADMSTMHALTHYAERVLSTMEKARHQKYESDRLLRAADGLMHIVSCIENIINTVNNIDNWDRMSEYCAELQSYLTNFDKIGIGVALHEEEKRLFETLREADHAPSRLWMGAKMAHSLDLSSHGNPLESLHRAAGAFRAASALLRMTA